MNLRDFYIWSLVGEAQFPLIRQGLDKYLKDFEAKNMHITEDFCNFDHKDEMIRKTETYIEMLRTFITNKEPGFFFNKEGLFCLTGQYFLNTNAFLSTIQMLGTKEQVKFWEDLTLNGRIIGAYAQTEMGHGSDVQKLETRADFDDKLRCFLLNTPKTSSTKLWAGLLGTIATHCVIQAQTYIKGKYVGLQTFVLQVRDIKTYAPIPGVLVGDQGPKLGFLGVDNGFMHLTNVRVPVESFLMRYSTISNEGKFTPPKDKNAVKFGYGSMLNLRVILVKGFAQNSLAASSVAFTQASKDCLSPYISETMKELQLIKTYAYGFGTLLTSLKLDQIFSQYNHELNNNNPNVKQTLNEIHVLSASFKAFSGWKAVHNVRDCLSISPISFLKMSGLPIIYGSVVPYVTYEGDNSVLTQQTARFLLKELQKLQNENAKLAHCTSFFKNCLDNPHNEVFVKKREDYMDLNKLEKLFEYFAFLNTKAVAEDFASILMQGVASKTAWNERKLVDLINSSIVFISVINFKYSKEMLASLENRLEPITFKALNSLIGLLALEMIEEFSNKLLLFNLIEKDYRSVIYGIKMDIVIEFKKRIPEFINVLKMNIEPFFKDKLVGKFDFSKKFNEYFDEFTDNAKELSKELNMESKL